MLLAIDIGNTTLYFGIIENDKIIDKFRIATNKKSLSDEYAVIIKNILKENSYLNKIDSVIIASVVPELTEEIEKAILKILNLKAIVVKRDVKESFAILSDCLRDLGADLIADSVGAISKYGMPVMIFDMGTATTCSVINKDGEFLGGLICPGLKTSMNALIGNASQLSNFELRNPTEVVGKETSKCINNGVIFGHSEMIKGLKKLIEAETNEKYKVILTGGNSDYISNCIENDFIQDKDLILFGLNELYKKYMLI